MPTQFTVAPFFTNVPSKTGFSEVVTVIIRSASSRHLSELTAHRKETLLAANFTLIRSTNAAHLLRLGLKMLTSFKSLAVSIASNCASA